MALKRCLGVRNTTGSVQYAKVPIYASSTFKKGDFLIWDTTNGAVTACAAGASLGAIGTSTLIIGRANEDALDQNGVVKKSVEIVVANDQTEFEICIYHSTPASAVPTPLTQLFMYASTKWELAHLAAATLNGGGTEASPDCMVLDIGNTSNPKMYITDYFPEDLPTWPDATTAGTVKYPRVWVKFVKLACGNTQ